MTSEPSGFDAKLNRAGDQQRGGRWRDAWDRAAESVKELPLLRADPHRWGQGYVHQIDTERDQTMCGRTPVNCPGTAFSGTLDDISCRVCLRAIAARERVEALRQEWDKGEPERERQRQENDRLWWQQYSAYLASPTWEEKRAAVHRRAGGICEGCGKHASAHVHHRRYPQGCWAGSPEWLEQEKLFDLIALCHRCHEEMHRHDRY